jgi:hypothetical protein
LLFSLPRFLHFSHYLFVGLDPILGLEILLLNFSDPLLVLGFELIEFVKVHLTDGWLVVHLVWLDWLRVIVDTVSGVVLFLRREAGSDHVRAAQFIQICDCIRL